MRWIFRCAHSNYTWPIRIRYSDGKLAPPHVCCLECGAEARYDMEEMRPIWNKREQIIKANQLAESVD